MNNSLRVLAFTNNTASEYWRFHGIADRMNEPSSPDQMYVSPYYSWNDKMVGGKDGANLVILEQLSNPTIVDYCHQRGCKVIFESDDAMIDSYGRERKNLQHLGEAFRGHAIETIRKCDALTVTNQTLADNYRRFTKAPIYVLPNYVDFNWYGKEVPHIQRTTQEVRLGWFGSKGHYEDLRWLVPVLNKVLAKYPQTRFVYCGYGGMSSDKSMTEIGWGEDVFKEIPRNRREFYIATTPMLWPSKHRSLDIDIGISPLIDDYFNKCKTPIKWLEYGVLETPAVLSPTLYGDYVKSGKDGLIASSADEWFSAICKLVESKQLRRQIGKAARHTVEKNWDLEKHWQDFVKIYREVVFGDLTKSVETATL